MDNASEEESIPEDDPELEREFDELAKWLLDAYRYRRKKKRSEEKPGEESPKEN